MSKEPKAFFINLDRRPDRRINLVKHLGSIGVAHTRVRAVDAFDLDSSKEVEDLCSKGEVACWLSHCAALRAGIESSQEYFLVLEDDAVFCDLPDWPSLLENLVESMHVAKIDVLQIGFIEHLASYRNLERILSFLLARARRDFIYIGYGRSRKRVQLFEFLAGAHAYIVSKSAAEVISKFNYPVARAADDFFGDLAIRGKNRPGLRFGRLTKSLVSQASRGGEVGAQIDSDTSPE